MLDRGFEVQLFGKGRFVCKQVELEREAKRKLGALESLAQDFPITERAEFLTPRLEEVYWQMHWKWYVNNKVPRKWEESQGVEEDIEIAARRSKQLPPDLIHAAVRHSRPEIMIKTALTQKLDATQLAILTFRGAGPYLGDIYRHQSAVGSGDLVHRGIRIQEDLQDKVLDFLSPKNGPVIATHRLRTN